MTRFARQLKSNQTQLHLILPLRCVTQTYHSFSTGARDTFSNCLPSNNTVPATSETSSGSGRTLVTGIRKKKTKIMETNRKNKFGDNHWKHGRCSDTQQVNNCQEVLLLGYRMLRTQKASFVATGPTMQLVSVPAKLSSWASSALGSTPSQQSAPYVLSSVCRTVLIDVSWQCQQPPDALQPPTSPTPSDA